MFPVGFGFGAFIAGVAPGFRTRRSSYPLFISSQYSNQVVGRRISAIKLTGVPDGSGISRRSICGGSGAFGATVGAVASSGNLGTGLSMGGKPPYPTGRPERLTRFPVLKRGVKFPIRMFLSPLPSLGANAGQTPALSLPGSPKSIPPDIKWYSLLRGVEGW